MVTPFPWEVTVDGKVIPGIACTSTTVDFLISHIFNVSHHPTEAFGCGTVTAFLVERFRGGLQIGRLEHCFVKLPISKARKGFCGLKPPSCCFPFSERQITKV